MTDTFWIAGTVLILVALAFVLYPVFFHKPRARLEADLRNQNLLAYRTRLKELENERDAGILDEDSYRQLKEELAGAMLDDVPEDAEVEPRVPGRRSAMVVALLALIVLPVGTYYGYERWGSLDQVEQFIAMQEMGDAQGDQVARMVELAEQLRLRLEESPENPDGWAMLGQTYMRIEQYGKAAEAYQRLAEVMAEDTNASAVALGLAAQATYFGSEGEMTPAVREAIAAARALNPDEVNALGLMGISAFGDQNYQQAIEYWQRILDVAPDHPQIAAIRGGIEEAYRRLGQTPPEQTGAEPQQPTGPGVSLRVSLDDGLKRDIDNEAVLFIFARPAGASGGAPVAVAKLTAGDLPSEIRLDDRYAMSPDSAISGQDDVVVVARVSRSGSVNPQPGDWEGRVEASVLPASEVEQPVELVINQELTN
ncbi:c-type cytochrome biogenesis protein CcmI [Marinobacter sp. VGCF2001]|uniref:c-type cytochrome biogenesis protein CcmI n=1 Tax=Marinobacter sp. VGCF2001 TaxID=3417189 RepID=UPI003CEA8004